MLTRMQVLTSASALDPVAAVAVAAATAAAKPTQCVSLIRPLTLSLSLSLSLFLSLSFSLLSLSLSLFPPFFSSFLLLLAATSALLSLVEAAAAICMRTDRGHVARGQRPSFHQKRRKGRKRRMSKWVNGDIFHSLFHHSRDSILDLKLNFFS
jgi:hypothetical protein